MKQPRGFIGLRKIMKIGIVGSGNIGGNLGKHWVKAGHEVMFSSRHPEDLKLMADEVGAKVGTTEETAAFGEVILLAIPFGKVPDVARQIGSLDSKILIDAGNPYPSRDGDVAQKVIDDESQTATGYVASQFPGAKTVKAFNSSFAPQDLGDLSQGVLFEPNAPLYNQNLKIREAEKRLSQIQ